MEAEASVTEEEGHPVVTAAPRVDGVGGVTVGVDLVTRRSKRREVPAR